MSPPPRRWLEGSEPRGLGRSLLEAGAQDTLDPARRARLWQAISAQLPTPPDGGQGPHDPGLPAPPAGDSGPTDPSGTSGPMVAPDDPLPSPAAAPGASSLLSASGAKVLAWSAALGLTALAGYWMAEPIGFSPWRSPAVTAAPSASPPPVVSAIQAPVDVPAPVASVAASSAPVATAAPRRAPASEPRAVPVDDEPREAPAEAPTAAPAPSASALTPAETAAIERANRLREEAEMVRQARAALRAGNAGEALRTLAATQSRFGAGGLSQEREALTIEALGQSGQRDQARARAEAFLRAYPASPHAADVRRFAP